MEEIDMYKSCQLIYDFREHGLYYQNHVDDTKLKKITLVIDTLQLECDYVTGALLSVGGFLPLLNAYKKFLAIPHCIEKKLVIKTDNTEYIPGMSYDFFKFYPDSKKYFIKEGLPIITYDDKNERILIGEKNILCNDNIQINKNIICSINTKGNIQAIMLLLDGTIKV